MHTSIRLALAAGLASICLGTVSAQAQGYIDEANPFFVAGWACGGGAGSSLWVHVFDGATYLGSTTSNTIARHDAAAHCSGNPWVGWSLALPSLTPGNHTIRAYASGSAIPSTQGPLGNPTTLFIPSANFAGPSPFGVLEGASAGSVSGWCVDTDAVTPTPIDVYVQFDGTGEPVLVASGVTGIARPDVPYGAGASGFSISLPPLRGGEHNVFARARNFAAGADSYLERHGSLGTRVSFPYEVARNTDPALAYAVDCWRHSSWSNLSSCPTSGEPIWNYTINATAPTFLVPEPQFGYLGASARVRYDGLAGGGFVWKVDTFDTLPNVNPWARNYQSVEVRDAAVTLGAVDRLSLEARLATRVDFFRYASSDVGPGMGIETGNVPWIHVHLSVDFSGPGGLYTLEIVPLLRENQSPSSLELVSSSSRRVRLALDDPRLSGAIDLPTKMLLGEERTINVDLAAAFGSVWPGVSTDSIVLRSAKLGTEQYGRNRIALEMRRLAVVAHYRAPVIEAFIPSTLTVGPAPGLLIVEGRHFDAQSRILWNGIEITTTFWSSTSLFATVPAAFLAAPSLASVQVVNPGPGGGPSNVFALSVVPFVCNSPSRYCVPAPTPSGSRARIDVAGSQNVHANDFTLLCSGAAPSTFGLFFYGRFMGSSPAGDGILCIANPLYRLPAVATDNTGAASFRYDLTQPPDYLAQILGNSTWNFSFWFRQASPGGSNFSDALNVRFCH